MKFISELQRTANQNVFVMMRYRSTPHFEEMESCIREILRGYGLIARLAKDSAVVDDLWGNIIIYMEQSRFGIAIFEDIDERDFNPNISLELGYMYALGKRCLLLKEKRMPRLPTDICGRIYRDFDVLNLRSSIEEQMSEWCRKDLGLSRVDGDENSVADQYVIAFDNSAEDPKFRTWGVFSTDGLFSEHIRLRVGENLSHSPRSREFIELSVGGMESVGINKDVPSLQGRARFEYKAIHSNAENPNLLFCMIPMQNELSDLLEVGAKRRSEPANAYSPYRLRHFVPGSHIGDDIWHQAVIDFDFRNTPTASYSIFAPRINEGCPRPGAGRLYVRNFELLVPVEDHRRLDRSTPSSPNSRAPADHVPRRLSGSR